MPGSILSSQDETSGRVRPDLVERIQALSYEVEFLFVPIEGAPEVR